MKARIFILLVCGAVVGSGVARAQSLPQSDISEKAVPRAEPTETSTAGTAVEDPNAVLIPEPESRPTPPPIAQEVDAPEGFEGELALLEKELSYYREGAEAYAADLRDRIRVAYRAQKELLSQQYDKAIEDLENEERRRRLEAIARFEEFIAKYPNDATYTPDAMFRLAELYFEKSNDEYLLASRAYEDELLAYDRGERETEPEPPEPNYEQTIALHRRLLERFPSYRLADAARYLLGYSYSEQGQPERALQAYLDLTANHPTSSFLPEVWTRIGEIYFDRTSIEDLERALAAYSEVEKYPDSPYYDKALYKIAWTHYRLNQYEDSVASFIELVEYADQQEKLTGVTGSELRAEAIEYVAISLADEEWGGFDRARQVLGPIEEESYTAEMWREYGDVLFDQTRYDDAIRAYRYAIQRYPNDPGNPEAQEKIVRAYERLRDFDGATEARERLVRDYGAGSPWYVANQDDEDAIRKAEGLTEKSLYTAAIFRHRQAQAYKSDGKIASATDSYQQAADAYQQYLKRFPKSSNTYDFEFYLAECLFYSGDLDRAAQQYEEVRDSSLNNKHLEAAALSAVITYERLVEEQVERGQLPAAPLQTAEERAGRPVQPRELADVRKELVDASDRYLTLIPDGPRAPAIAYRAAEVYYRHDRFDEARERFERIVATYPDDEVARYASNLIIESYLAVEDWEAVEKVSNRLMARAKEASSEEGAEGEFLSQLQMFKVGAQFKQAEKFDRLGEYEKAADTYVRLVDENPKHEFADKALFNAAIAYERVKRFDSASQVYRRIYDDYPKSDLAPRALFRTGLNAEKGFDFDSAIDAYGRLAQRYPDSENRADAMYNVAVVLENMQNYEEAAEAYERYAKAFPGREDSGLVFFRSALVYEKMKAWPEMIETLEAFVRTYRDDPSQRQRIVYAHQKMGEAHEALGDGRQAQRAYAQCVRIFQRSRLGIRSKAGGYAADCQFELAEAQFREYDAIAIEGTGRRQVRALQRKAKVQRQVEKAYRKVFDYKRVETTLAASYRIGHTYERFAEALFTAPIPKEFQDDEELAMEYKLQLEDRAAVLERKAETAYRKAYDEARKTRVTNVWTRRILEGLNKYAPNEFPIQKQGKPVLQTYAISGRGLLRPELAQAPPESNEQPQAPKGGSSTPGGASGARGSGSAPGGLR
jgi:cellulose synthase operon protein C